MKQTCNKDMEDLEVIHSYLESQASNCFSLLYNRYATKIFSKCISLLKDEALAKDATQEIFTKIFLNLSRFGEKSKFSTWVYSITYNYCIDYIRKMKKRDIFSDELENVGDVEDDGPEVDEELLQMEVRHLRQVLEEIPIGDKTILLMKYQDDLSIKDIADILDKSESAVKMQIKRAKERAQKKKQELFQETET
ncbi:MAG: RNA polymerase sigma factor [Saprospiraceae bacterium]